MLVCLVVKTMGKAIVYALLAAYHQGVLKMPPNVAAIR